MELSTSLPVVVIGAGPVGLAAAAHLLAKGEVPVVLEAGAAVGANLQKWAHVRMFSPWRYNVDPMAAALLRAAGVTVPNGDDLPTGGELVTQYLAPLADLPAMRPHIRLKTRVVAVARLGFDKVKNAGRDGAPFLIRVVDGAGKTEEILARAVIDASGTYQFPNPLGASGLPAIGEPELADRIAYGIPDVLGADRARYAGRRTMVVGSGHSAMNALLDLVRLADTVPGTEVTWVVRRPSASRAYGGGLSDGLPARGRIGSGVRAQVEAGRIRLVTGFGIARVTLRGEEIILAGVREGGMADLPPADQVIAATGARPDLAALRELRLDLDPALESPSALAPLIDPNVHSCGTVRPHGADLLRHPESNFYIVGAKSYGRAPTFLLLTGYEQVRSVVAVLTGDWAGARSIELTLPETGVCGISSDDSCCAAPGFVAISALG